MKTVKLVILSGFVGTSGVASAAAHCKAENKSLESRAKITCDQAQRTAVAKVPNSKVKSAELEEEHGKLVYSFDLSVKGKSGIEEVQVDAITGEIASVEHETAKHEAQEKRQEKSEKSSPVQKK